MMSEGFDWIGLVVRVAKVVGLNPVRVRWKLQAWQNQVLARRDRAVMEGRSLTRGLKTCPACGALAAGADRSCAQCGAPLHSAPVEFLRRLLRRLGIGLFAETGIALAIIAAFAVTAAATGPAAMISFPGPVLIDLGGNFAPRTIAGQWWRLWTSVFLHGGVMQLGFNLVALYYIAPRARDLYGGNRMLIVYALSGLAASAASAWWSLAGDNGVSIGASGAISGLIGLMMVRGWTDKTSQGIALRNSMLRWMAYVIVFGLFIGADNAAHLGGFAVGSLLGTVLPRRLRSSVPGLERAAGSAVLIAAAAAVAGIGWLAWLATHGQIPH